MKQAIQTDRLTIRLPLELKEKANYLRLNLSEICRAAIVEAIKRGKKR